jgi:hypothetical protein
MNPRRSVSLRRPFGWSCAALLVASAAGCGDDAETPSSGGEGGGAGASSVATSSGASTADATSTSPGSTSSTTSDGGGGTGGAGGDGSEGGGGAAASDFVLFDISESDASDREHEPAMVVTDDGRIVVAWLAFVPDPNDYYHIDYRISDDRGETWGAVQTMPQQPGNNVSANASLDVDADGVVYLAYGSLLRSQTDRENVRVHLATLAPGDETFSDPVEVTDPDEAAGIYDQPAITINDDGDWVVTYGQGNPALTATWMAAQRSTDEGETWDKVIPSQSVSNHFQNLIHPCKAPGTDRLYLFYLDAEHGLTLWRSEDGGRTWPVDQRTAVQSPDEDASVSTGLDSNCVASGDEVWAVYGLTGSDPGGGQTLAQLTDVRLAHSSDGGATIDSRSTVHDAGGGTSYLMPHISLAADGTIDLTYVAGDGPDDEAASFRHARSTDGGLTFSPSTALVAPVTYELERADETWFGDYTALAHHDGTLFGAVLDNSSGRTHVVFFRSAP